MKENTYQHYYSYWDFAHNNDMFWYITDDNFLMEYCIEKKQLRVVSFIGEKADKYEYRYLIYKDNNIYLLPFYGKIIKKYNLITGFVESIYADDNPMMLNGAFIDDEKIVMYGFNKNIYIYDTRLSSINIVNLGSVLENIGSNVFFKAGGKHANDYILPIHRKNQYLRIDKQSFDCSLIDVTQEEEERFYLRIFDDWRMISLGISKKDYKFQIVNLKNNRVECNCVGSINELNRTSNKVYGILYCDLALINNQVIAIPGDSANIIIYNPETGKVCITINESLNARCCIRIRDNLFCVNEKNQSVDTYVFENNNLCRIEANRSLLVSEKEESDYKDRRFIQNLVFEDSMFNLTDYIERTMT